MNSFIVAQRTTPKKSHLCTPPSSRFSVVITGFGMNALTLQDLLKYKIIGYSSFQNLGFLVVTSFVPPSISSKYVAYFIPSWKKCHSKLCLCHVCSL